MNIELKNAQLKKLIPGRAWSSLLYSLIFLGFTSCEKHDFIDDQVITGSVGPQAYWEVASSTVSAGSEMDFVLQYYSTASDIDYSEVWYNLTETQEKTVSCPWLATFSYSYNSITSEEKRISQKIKEFPHSLALWSDSLHAYTFSGKFPVSGTLSPFAWVKPEVFDSTLMESYFGKGFMQHFKDSLYTLMKYADFKNMYLGMSLVDNFMVYTDSTFDVNSNSYVYHFPKNINGESPVPDDIRNLYTGITFDRLIEGTSGYNVEFKRTYYLQAKMRIYDKKGTYGTTVTKRIDVN